MTANYNTLVAGRRPAGFVQVRFDDPSRGGIPSFSSGEAVWIARAGAAPLALGGEATSAAGLQKEIESLYEAVASSWTGEANVRVIMERYQALKAKIELWEQKRGQQTQITEAFTALRAAVKEALLR